MNAQEGLNVSRQALEDVKNYSCQGSVVDIASAALAATASIEQPEVASVDSLTRLSMRAYSLPELYARMHLDADGEYVTFDNAVAHCAQQVAAAVESYDEMLRELCAFLCVGGYNSAGIMSVEAASEKIRAGIDAMIAVERERALAARIEPGEPVASALGLYVNRRELKFCQDGDDSLLTVSREKTDWHGIPIYAAPQPSAQPAPEAAPAVDESDGAIYARVSRATAPADLLAAADASLSLARNLNPAEAWAGPPPGVPIGRLIDAMPLPQYEHVAKPDAAPVGDESAALHRPVASPTTDAP